MEIILALIGLFFLFYILRGVLRFSKINYNTNLEQYMQMLEVPDEFFEEDQWGQGSMGSESFDFSTINKCFRSSITASN